LQLFFKIFFILKYIKIIFFYLLKIIFEISEFKQFKIHKKILNILQTQAIKEVTNTAHGLQHSPNSAIEP
jgi:hypothetical protein